MEEKDMTQPGQKRGPFTYYAIIIVVVLLLNAYVFPKFLEPSTEEVDYGTFLTMVDRGIVTEAEIEGEFITFKTVEDEEETIYETSLIEDENCVERLNAAQVKCTDAVLK